MFGQISGIGTQEVGFLDVALHVTRAPAKCSICDDFDDNIYIFVVVVVVVVSNENSSVLRSPSLSDAF